MIDYFRRTMKHLKLLPVILLLSSCSLIGDLLFPDGFGVRKYKKNCCVFYRISNVRLAYADIGDQREAAFLYPYYTDNANQNAESLTYYSELDTVLHQNFYDYNSRPAPKWEAFDWRITKMEAITLVDLDAEHPAGSFVSDLVSVQSCFRSRKKNNKLSNVSFGDIMLQDYYNGIFYANNEYGKNLETSLVGEWLKKDLFESTLTFSPTGNPTVDLHNIEIHIYTAFGDHFIARSETKEQE